jgi:hypothetical protein
MTRGSDREELAAASLNVPPGVSGRQRELYLSLTDDQKRSYRRHWFLCGRPAAICHRYATEEWAATPPDPRIVERREHLRATEHCG